MGAKGNGDDGGSANVTGAGARLRDDHAAAGTHAATDTIEVSGSIKWFDAGKGFGFIVPDNGMADVLLHVTCLRRDGYQTAYEGARIVVEALNRPGGLQAFRVVSMDESTARHPSQLPAPRTHVTVEPTSGMVRLEDGLCLVVEPARFLFDDERAALGLALGAVPAGGADEPA